MYRKNLCFLLLIILCFSLNAQKAEKMHSPTKATLLSTIPPGGLGQIYNEQAWKVPIIYVLEGTCVYLAVTNYQGAKKFKNEYRLRANGIIEGRDPNYTNYPDESIYNLYYAYERNFELAIFGGVLVYALNIIDAMVFAHLFSYDISDKLSINLSPALFYTDFTSFGLTFNLKF